MPYPKIISPDFQMKRKSVKSTFFALGTEVETIIVVASKKEQARARVDIRKIKNLFRKKQRVFCRFNPESELSRLNKNLGVWQEASPDILYLAKRALFYHQESGGIYDPRVIDVLDNIGYKSAETKAKKTELKSERFKKLPADLRIEQNKIFFSRRMDFTGIAKGYIIDQAAEFLRKRSWKNFFINVNGDAYAAGRNKKGEKWKLPVEGATDKETAVYISNEGVATSGVIKKQWKHKGKNVHHLINPKNTGKFSFEIRSVLVIHKKTEWADGRAKVLVLMGKKKGLAFAKKKKLQAIFADRRGKIMFSNIQG
ncbi:MAG: hypothetical protein COS72_01070 [Candidatus Moranbacteria bacterium CG06_land_8_20_14_3_00_43_56]|nr:MAG: hypothetical protein COS72_01070 [Candidatus Moranbacteria bacterium CG06_land_8_20_14_3_00_43_56]PIV83904.1 MAG: hypothetical protein COW51_02445 [Candidatus Moranbacteria bacterium CG17_big_fil_post_rev_8_21_14_2_50_44_12]PIW93687.1 MAG: hypothetical protein COZ87_00010 [Candidatus Moranbacteria bacterium CG_4_8_14_3_um_filter_43_15]